MAVTFPLYRIGIQKIVEQTIDWDTDTIKCALVETAYIPSQAHDFWDDVSANESAQTGYTAGGATLTCSAPVGVGAEIRMDSTTNPQWTITGTLTAYYGVVYKDTGTPSTSPLIGYVDFGQVETCTDSTFTITWAANSVFKMTVT